MTATAEPSAGTTGGRSRRGVAAVVAVGVVLLLVVLVVAAPGRRRSGPPLDPRSTDPSGTAAMVELADRLGADVDITSSLPDGATDVALVLDAGILDDDDTAALFSWVEAGGTLVLADPFSDLTPSIEPLRIGVLDDTTVVAAGACDVTVVQGVEQLTAIETPPPAYRFDVATEAQSCFGDGGHGVVVAEPVGAGALVAFGAPYAFTNEQLDQADNAGLFAALAVPVEGTRLDVLVAGEEGDPLTDDEGAVGDVLPDGVWLALLQLVVAFVVYALSRARRLGKPVAEDPPVAVAGSELVRAVGTLLDTAGERGWAADALRRATRQRLATRFGLPAGAATDEVVGTVAARTSIPAERLRAALVDAPVADDAALAALGVELDRLADEALAPPGPPSADAGPAAPPSPPSPPAPALRPDRHDAPNAPDAPQERP